MPGAPSPTSKPAPEAHRARGRAPHLSGPQPGSPDGEHVQRPLACRQRDLTGPPRRRSPITTDSDEDGQRDKGEGEKVAGLDGGRKHADTPTCPTPRANGHYLTRSRSAATRSTIIHQCSTTNLHSSAGYRCGWLGGPESTRPPRVMRPGLQMHRTPGSGTVRPIAPTNRQASRTAVTRASGAPKFVAQRHRRGGAGYPAAARILSLDAAVGVPGWSRKQCSSSRAFRLTTTRPTGACTRRSARPRRASLWRRCPMN